MSAGSAERTAELLTTVSTGAYRTPTCRQHLASERRSSQVLTLIVEPVWNAWILGADDIVDIAIWVHPDLGMVQARLVVDEFETVEKRGIQHDAGVTCDRGGSILDLDD